ncbi:hypothetical protein F4811DRAFT_416670 [Daldinia bambusicola]|nr:hypothetical protein F4811DRAFT_416670 [Daldinia bambusicola]
MDAQVFNPGLAAAILERCSPYHLVRSDGVVSKEDTKPAHFTLFPSLPIELRYMIWEFSLPPDEREVWFQRDRENQFPSFPLGFPVAMHVCQESRAFVRQRLQFYRSPAKPYEIPCRAFRPDFDIWMLSGRLLLSDSMPLEMSEKLQYVAVNGLAAISEKKRLVRALPYLKSLKTLHIIFTTDVPLQRGRRPYKLLQRVRSAEELPWGCSHKDEPEIWRAYLADLAKELLPEWDDDTKATLWDDEKQTFRFNFESDYYFYFIQHEWFPIMLSYQGRLIASHHTPGINY